MPTKQLEALDADTIYDYVKTGRWTREAFKLWVIGLISTEFVNGVEHNVTDFKKDRDTLNNTLD